MTLNCHALWLLVLSEMQIVEKSNGQKPSLEFYEINIIQWV